MSASSTPAGAVDRLSAEAAGGLEPQRGEVQADDASGAASPQRLDDLLPDRAEPEHERGGPRHRLGELDGMHGHGKGLSERAGSRSCGTLPETKMFCPGIALGIRTNSANAPGRP